MRRILELGTRYLVPRFDPLRCDLALFVRAIHRERSHHSVQAQPPDAEALTGNISAVNHLFRPGGVAPKLVGEVEYIGEEIGDVLERSPLAHQGLATMLALGDGVVPMLHATALGEQDVLIVGNVSRGPDVGAAGLQVLVDHHAVFHFETTTGEHFRYRPYADSRDDQFACDRLAVRQYRGAYGTVAAQFAHLRLTDEPYAAPLIVGFEKAGHLGREKRFPDAVLAHHHGD